jgi:ATP-dependent Clp protease ATP-binding subunit ClpC
MADSHPSVRDASRRTVTATGARGSCDLLLTLCTRDPVAQLLGEASVGPGQLLEARQDLEAVLGPEPADWRLRLANRGGGDGDLELLLAICRSADSHAYQLLEQLGVCCATLRRKVIDRLRDEGTAALRSGVSIPTRPPAATMSRARRSVASARPGLGRAVRTARLKAALAPRPSARTIEPARDPDAPTPRAREQGDAPRTPPDERRLAEARERTEANERRLAEVRGRTDVNERRLAEARSRSDAKERRLAEARERSEANDRRLAEARERSEANDRRLAEARERTDAADRRLAEARARTSVTPPPRDAPQPPIDRPADVSVRKTDPRLGERIDASPRASVRRAVEAERRRTEDDTDRKREAVLDTDRERERTARRDTLRARRVDPKRLAPLHGRERELGQLADALGRRRIRVPLIVAPAGCGRTLLAQHLATQFVDPVFHLEATAYDDEQSLADDLAAIDRERGIAIFDDIDRVPSEAAPPFLGALTHAWTTGHPRILTIVSPEGHGRLATWVPGALESADAIRVDPLHGAPLEAAVRAAAPGVLAQHRVALAPDAKLGELTRWAERHLTGLAMPARALDLLDLACARTVRRGALEVDRTTWLAIVSERTGLSPARIEARGDQEILDLEQRLAESVVGHDAVTAAIARLVRRNRAGFGGQRPVLTSLLLGPSGVGKTELAKALAHALFDRDDALLRLDMSEYAESHAVARIIGAPPGYVGHEHGGALSDPLLRRPHCVVLLDEIEKAHRDVHQLLLQVFDDGRLTDGRGRTVDFRHAAIIMTSNLGADRIERGAHGPTMDEAEVLAVARAAFPVELWNRIEAPLVMQPLTPDEMARICRRLATGSSERLFKERGIRYALTDDACSHLVRLAGRDPSLGARPLRHLLVREVESVIADAILRGQLRAGSKVSVELDRNRLTLA